MKKTLLLSAAVSLVLTGSALAQQTASITDLGNSNSFAIQQVAGVGSVASIYGGNDTTYGRAEGVQASIYQNGANGSTATISAWGGNGTPGSAVALINQQATGSNASINQYGNAGWPNGGTYASISQSGSNQTAGITQGENQFVGGAFSSTIQQSGDSHEAYSSQHLGTGVLSTIVQSNVNNYANVAQTGSNLTATVIQSGTNGSATITQQ